MPLFVTLSDGRLLDDALRRKIRDRLRQEYTPRHVPDQIIQVREIPATLTGKKMEGTSAPDPARDAPAGRGQRQRDGESGLAG